MNEKARKEGTENVSHLFTPQFGCVVGLLAAQLGQRWWETSQSRGLRVDQLCWLGGTDGTWIWSSKSSEIVDDPEPVIRVYLRERKLPSWTDRKEEVQKEEL